MYTNVNKCKKFGNKNALNFKFKKHKKTQIDPKRAQKMKTKKNVRKKLFTYCSVSPYSLTAEESGRTFLSFLLHSTLINRYIDKKDREINK